jgi:hypothetical protein
MPLYEALVSIRARVSASNSQHSEGLSLSSGKRRHDLIIRKEFIFGVMKGKGARYGGKLALSDIVKGF